MHSPVLSHCSHSQLWLLIVIPKLFYVLCLHLKTNIVLHYDTRDLTL